MKSRSRRLAACLALVVGAGALSTVVPVAAAPDDQAFAPLRGFEPSGAKVRVEPKEYAASRVDLGALRGELPRGGASAVIDVPAPDGRLQSFRVQQTQRMESELAAAHPEITTWSGRGIDDPSASIALDVTQMGFHAFVRTPGGRSDWYVDPAYNRPGTTAHLSYRSVDLPAAAQRRAEGEVQAIRSTVAAKAADRSTPEGAAVQRHHYRLALTSDPSYAAYFGTANVLAEKVTLINRVNQIYNDDLATELRLVNDTEKLNFDTDAEATAPGGPCGDAPCFRLEDLGGPGPDDDIPGDLDFCSGLTLGQNRTVLGQLIGASNYDVGHIALGNDGGGVAYLGVVGGDYKGGGCTGLPEPKGDFFAIDYVAHELGHQFAGNHTFNGALGSCGGNISEAAVEPGSGSSVMAYAGICRQDNLQPHTDPYFSFRTIDEVDAYRAATYPNIEVQTVSLRDFDPATDSLSVRYGTGAPVPVAAYTPAGIDAAVEAASGTTVSIAEWGFDENGLDDTPLAPDATGFQVIFNESPTVQGATAADIDRQLLTVTVTGTGEAFTGETARGGPAQNDGIDLSPNGPGQVSDNSAPVVRAPADKTIPIRTPFALTGSGTDPNGDALVYLWEQTNFGGNVQVDPDTGERFGQTRLDDNTKTYGPLFRVFGDDAVVSVADSLKSPAPGINLAEGSPTRVFPDLKQVLAGNTNAATGTCPAPPATVPPERFQMPDRFLDCFSEFLPTADYRGNFLVDDRVMHFRLTARDQDPNGGGIARDDVALTVDPSAGPFLVTSQAGAGTVAGGSSVPVTWAVNNTQKLAPNVKISLSTDNGATFGTVLAESTPNDGSETLAMPNVDASAVRIKVEAVGNYFFDVNDAAFTLVAVPAPETTIVKGPENGAIVLESKQRFTFSSSVTPATFRCTLDGKAVDCADGAVRVKVKPGTHVFSVAAVNAAGVADATPETRTFTRPLDDDAFKRSGRWTRVKEGKAYGNDYVTSQDRGATLSRKIRKATEVVLVVATRKQVGLVNVFVGQKRIKTVNLRGKNRFSKLRRVDLGKTRTGKLRVVVVEGTARIEGVAVVKKTG